MQRFVYTPKVEAYIRNERTQQVIDVTDDIISGEVARRLNAMSTVSLTLQNKRGKYLQPDSSGKMRFVFEPMDRIIIRMARVGQPMLLFSGYLDETPYYQLYPGPVTLTASDSLKLLQYTYFDPGLPYMYQFFQQFGWSYDPASGTLYDPAHKMGNFDIGGGIGDVITAALNQIGNWPKDAIEIHNLPPKFVQNIATMMRQNAQEEDQQVKDLAARIKKMLSVDLTIGGSAVGGYTNAVHGTVSPEEVAQLAINAGFKGNSLIIAVAIAWAESTLKSDADNYNQDGSWDYGLWQINTVHASGAPNGGRSLPSDPALVDPIVKAFRQQMFTPSLNAQQAYAISSSGTSFTPWSTFNNGAYKKYLNDAQTAVQGAALLGGGKASVTTPDAVAVQTGSLTTAQRAVAGGDQSGTIATRVVQLAVAESKKGIREIGNTNSGPEISKYQAVTGAYGAAWCASFAQWIYKTAGRPLTETGLSAGVATIQKAADQNGWDTKNPRAADLVTFRTHTDADPSDDHIGVVVRVVGSSVYTVEGNHSNGVNSAGPYSINDPTLVFIRVPGIGLPAANADTSVGSDPSINPNDPLTPDQVAKIATQAAWFTAQFQSNDVATAQLLTGKRALANDVPLFEWVTSIIPSSGRVFCSKPDGSFLAFYPDYFGYYERTPYFRIADIEIIDLNIQRSDRNLVTHVFATGPLLDFQIQPIDRSHSMVASVEEEAFKAFINVPIDDPTTKKDEAFDPIQFLKKYGARPYPYDLPDVKNPILLWMAAWMKFSELWAQQFTANAQFTFLPEVLPGGLVAFGDRITMFVNSVTHSFDRSSGFSTSAELIAPAAIDDTRFPWLPQSGTPAMPLPNDRRAATGGTFSGTLPNG